MTFGGTLADTVPAAEPERARIYLYPGQVHASADPCEITTVLGSCVAVVLVDAVRGIGGATHFLLPFDRGQSPRFGNGAITELLRRTLALGSSRSNLVAKVFGGAQILIPIRPNSKSLGSKNIDLARQRLADECIPIVAEDVGGVTGRKVIFFTDLGTVWVKRL
jgi:chemotaxis protein CheD